MGFGLAAIQRGKLGGILRDGIRRAGFRNLKACSSMVERCLYMTEAGGSTPSAPIAVRLAGQPASWIRLGGEGSHPAHPSGARAFGPSRVIVSGLTFVEPEWS